MGSKEFPGWQLHSPHFRSAVRTVLAGIHQYSMPKASAAIDKQSLGTVNCARSKPPGLNVDNIMHSFMATISVYISLEVTQHDKKLKSCILETWTFLSHPGRSGMCLLMCMGATRKLILSQGCWACHLDMLRRVTRPLWGFGSETTLLCFSSMFPLAAWMRACSSARLGLWSVVRRSGKCKS